jgi:hypothetical protein
MQNKTSGLRLACTAGNMMSSTAGTPETEVSDKAKRWRLSIA